MLPQRALTLIREYSKPLTRPDWKTRKSLSYVYFNRILNNSKKNSVLRKFVINKGPVYTIDNLPFIIKQGQTYLYRMVTYIISKILPKFIIIYDSHGNKHKGILLIYYKNKLSNGALRRMESVCIHIDNNINIHLDKSNCLINK
jgi:hypothetical protein